MIYQYNYYKWRSILCESFITIINVHYVKKVKLLIMLIYKFVVNGKVNVRKK